MYLKSLFKKSKRHSELSPKDWLCAKPRLAHITTHAYNAEPFFQLSNLTPLFKKIMYQNAQRYKIDLLKIGCDYTHGHFIIRQDPAQNLRTIVGLLKGKTSLDIRKAIPWLKNYRRFWAKGFYVTLWLDHEIERAYKYLENQTREQEEKWNKLNKLQ